jgi:hypothetical protein
MGELTFCSFAMRNSERKLAISQWSTFLFSQESDDSSVWFDTQQNNTPHEFALDGPATSEE